MPDGVVLLIGVASAVTSLITATFGLGGGLLLLGLFGQVLEPRVLIPMHGVGQLFSSAVRAWIQRRFIQWRYLRVFLLGSVVGTAAFIPLVAVMPGWLGSILLGGFVLVASWRPEWLRLAHWPPVWSGGVTSGLCVLLGATGSLVMSVLPTQTWVRQQIVGTHSTAMAFQHGIKVVAFGLIGFNALEYWRVVIALLVGSIVGNVIGAKLLGRITDDRFRLVLRLVLTVLAVRMAWVGVAELLGMPVTLVPLG